MKSQPARDAVELSDEDSTPLPLFAMARFRRLMSLQGWAVDLARLCSDPAYMYECLARAHSCSEDQLRRVALVVFAGYGAQPASAAAH